MAQQDSWKPDIIVGGIGLVAGFAASFTMPRASVGSLDVTKSVIELLIVFVIFHYTRAFVQKIPIVGEIITPLLYGVQLLAASILSAGLAINLIPG